MRKYPFLLVLFLSTIFISNSFAVTYNATVAKDGTGNYTTVQAAFDAAPSNSTTRWVIYIKNGTYTEHITLPSGKNNVSIVGQSNTGVILTYNLYANTVNPATGSTWSFDCASLIIRGSGFYASNVTIQNNAGTAAQALAVNIQGDKTVFNNCRFLAHQDTWYGGSVRVYLKNCYIEGTTDFIYGPAIAFFDACSIYSYGGTAITAANTPSYIPYGLVFKGCTVTGASITTLLGRTWGAYAATAFINCSLSSIISAAGWSDWGNSANDATSRYNEYGNTGAGASTSGRVSWCHILTSSQAANYTVLNVLKGTHASPQVTDNWNPQTVIDQTDGSEATLTKHGSGPSSQTITLGTALTSFYYTWANATSVNVSGLPSGVTAVLDATAQTVTISGTPTVAGIYTYTITTTGGTPNASVSGTITVNSSTTSTLIYQAEDAVINTGVTETKNAGYTGTGYANAVNAIGTYVEWTVTTSTAGTFSIFFRYASVGDRPADIYVNGAKVISALAFPTTAAWTTWSTTAAQNVTLLNGVNTISVTSTTADGPANLDYLQVTGSGTLKSAKANSTADELTLYPNPVANEITLSGSLIESENATISIYSQLGRFIQNKNLGVIEKGNFKVTLSVSHIQPGIYTLKVQLGSKIKTLQFIKK
jgi:pectin methylesterase-like acyl-CoA thioesterase